MKKYFIALALMLVAFLVVAGCNRQAQQPSQELPAEQVSGTEGDAAETESAPKKGAKIPLVVEDIFVVEVTNSGFSPRELTIKAGDSVQFVAKDGGRHWPASAVHPTHETYPGSSISKCNGPEEETVFDACKVLSQDQVFEFRFREKGSWKYHDHLHPTLTGTITVEAKE